MNKYERHIEDEGTDADPDYKKDEVSSSISNALLCKLIAEWEVEADFLDTPNDADTDRACGRTYRECAKKLRIALGA